MVFSTEKLTDVCDVPRESLADAGSSTTVGLSKLISSWGPPHENSIQKPLHLQLKVQMAMLTFISSCLQDDDPLDTIGIPFAFPNPQHYDPRMSR